MDYGLISMQCKKCNTSCYSHGKRIRNIKDITNGNIIENNISISRYRCPSCNTFYNVPEIDNSGTSDTLKAYIIHQCQNNNYTEIAKKIGCSDNTIKNIFSKYIEKNFKEVMSLPPILSISKIIHNQKCFYIIYNVSTRKIIDITKNIHEWMQYKKTNNVKHIFCDICFNILKAIKHNLKNVTISIDINDYHHEIIELFKKLFYKIAREHNINYQTSNFINIKELTQLDNIDIDIFNLLPDKLKKARLDFILIYHNKNTTTDSIIINNFINVWQKYIVNTPKWKNIINTELNNMIKINPLSENHLKYYIMKNN
jgi:hypothetical protein